MKKIVKNVLLYGAALVALLLISSLLDKDVPHQETQGSLEGRFASDIRLQYQGRLYEYRDNELINILLIGVDRENLLEKDGVPQGGGQADLLILFSIDRRYRTITPVHIDRDAVTEIGIYGALGDPAGTRRAQICLAQAFGPDVTTNCQNTVAAVSGYLGGIDIDYYLAVDMSGIQVFNDAIGGVTVRLTEDFSHMDPEMTAGSLITLWGEQAEIYVRSRFGMDDATNRARMVRQQTYMNEAFRILLEGMREDIDYMARVYDALESDIVTDLSRTWIINRAQTYSEYLMHDICSVEGTHIVGEDGFVEFHADEDAMGAMLTRVFFEPVN